MCYSHLITSTVTPGNYKFLGLSNTEVGPHMSEVAPHMFFPHTNSAPCLTAATSTFRFYWPIFFSMARQHSWA